MDAISHDFDFVFGRWNVHNRKLRDVTDPDCTEWVEFEATSEAFPILEGVGHVDRIYVPDPPDGPPFEGFTLRLYDAESAAWSIWWSSTRAPGRLDPPVVGRFADGVGEFGCEDVVAGRPVRVRFTWTTNEVHPVWRQAFCDDGATDWRTNWEMTLTRRP
ncbi:MAG TPA: hypothetical protein VME70_01060 [Mycobacteriales bacterium]|nr:hypothetical protein [Mycobacteriales bacterium]